jgi:hypothetical protein
MVTEKKIKSTKELTSEKKPTSRKKAVKITYPSIGHIPHEELHKLIAVEAYFRAEKRGFSQGYDLEDWLEAEKDVKSYVY